MHADDERDDDLENLRSTVGLTTDGRTASLSLNRLKPEAGLPGAGRRAGWYEIHTPVFTWV